MRTSISTVPILFAAIAIIMNACGSPSAPATQAEKATDSTASTVPTDTVLATAEPSAKLPSKAQCTAHLTTIEDGPYPQFVLHLDTAGPNAPISGITMPFNLNIEAVEQTVEDLYALQNSIITIHYTTETDRYLMAVRNPEGLRIGSKALDPGWLEITGTLSGADAPTESDLPDTVTITDTNGNAIDFLEYITEELVAVNGTVVNAYYSERTVHNVTGFSKAE